MTATDAPRRSQCRELEEDRAAFIQRRPVVLSRIVSRNRFDEQVRFEFLDMNHIPSHYDSKFDFCWSVCAAEHLGSIDHGIRFIEKSLDVLVPGELRFIQSNSTWRRARQSTIGLQSCSAKTRG